MNHAYPVCEAIRAGTQIMLHNLIYICWHWTMPVERQTG